jgi:hypothetical protein
MIFRPRFEMGRRSDVNIQYIYVQLGCIAWRYLIKNIVERNPVIQGPSFEYEAGLKGLKSGHAEPSYSRTIRMSKGLFLKTFPATITWKM